MADYLHRRPIHSHSLRWLLPLMILVLAPLSAAAEGAIVWHVQISSPGYDSAEDLALDSAGNLYLVGTTEVDLVSNTGVYAAFLSKYTPDGTVQWTQLVHPADSYVYGHAVAVDSAGNVYLVGTTNTSLDGQAHAGISDAFVQKYDSAGTLQWTRLIGTAGGDTGEGVAVDAGGRVYVTGAIGRNPGPQPVTGSIDAFLSVYDASGSQQWTHQFGSFASIAYDVAVDAAQNVYLAGFIEGTIDGQTSTGDRDGFLRKYDRSGTPQWTRLTGNTGTDFALSVAVDAAGTSYLVGGMSVGVPGQPVTDQGDAFVRAYDSGGTLQWVRQFGSPVSDMAMDVALDATGALYVVGTTHGSLAGQSSAGGLSDMFVKKYAADGSARWTFMVGLAGFDRAQTTAVSASGALYLAGSTYSADQSDAVLIRSINPTLTPRMFLPLIPQ